MVDYRDEHALGEGAGENSQAKVCSGMNPDVQAMIELLDGPLGRHAAGEGVEGEVSAHEARRRVSGDRDGDDAEGSGF